MPTEKEFMSLEDIAKLLGVNYQLIYRLVRKGELPAVRIGRVYRVTKEDLEEYLEASRTSSKEDAYVCSVCGKGYASSESVKKGCRECGAPICFDCWQRRDVRVCPEH